MVTRCPRMRSLTQLLVWMSELIIPRIQQSWTTSSLCLNITIQVFMYFFKCNSTETSQVEKWSLITIIVQMTPWWFGWRISVLFRWLRNNFSFQRSWKLIRKHKFRQFKCSGFPERYFNLHTYTHFYVVTMHSMNSFIEYIKTKIKNEFK